MNPNKLCVLRQHRMKGKFPRRLIWALEGRVRFGWRRALPDPIESE
jgi:hypothetical protein